MVEVSRIAIAMGSLAAVAVASPAFAQDSNGSTAASPAVSSSAAASTPAVEPPNDGDIVVTAQRREERLSAVPISVTALSANTLQQNVINSTADLTIAVPGLNWGRSTNFSQPTIRGIGTRNASSGDEANVASFVDGVYLPDLTGTLFELSNIERIEVLRGPQTTLFGRNATGGAVNLITRAPSMDDFTGSASASAGSFGYYRLTGMISGPLVRDVLAFSISAVNYDDHGYIRNVYTGERQGDSGGTAIRGRLTLNATPNLSFQLNGLYSRSHNTVLQSQFAVGGNTQARNSIPGGPNAAVLNPTGIPANQIITSEPYTTATVRQPFAQTTQQFVDGHFDWDLGFATLSGLGAIGSTKTPNENWTDNSPIQLSHVQYTSLNHFKDEELTLTSRANNSFNWLLGVQGFQSNASFNPLLSTGRSTTTGAFLPVTTIYGQNTRAFAAFGEATWQPVQHFFMTGGLRYNRDVKDGFNTAVATNVTTRGHATFENLSPRATLRYEFAPESNIYLSYTRGFKSGTFNAVTAVGASLPANPETVNAYEAGIKVRLAPGIRLEAAAFHYDYRDLQVSTPVVVNGVSATTVQNAGIARINGFEASLDAAVTHNLHFNASVSLLGTKIEDFANASVQVPRTNAQGVPTLNGNLNVVLDVSGNHLLRAPARTFTVGANYRHELFGGEITANVTAFFSSRFYFDLTNRINQPAYEVVNASITWRAHPDHGFYASVFAQNLTDQVYLAGCIISSFIDACQANKPRWFGGTVGFNF